MEKIKMAKVQFNKKRERVRLSIDLTVKESKMMDSLTKHYNIKSKTDLIKALINSATDAINKDCGNEN